MAFRRGNPDAPPQQIVEIAPLASDVLYAAIAARRSVLIRGIADRRETLERFAIESELAGLFSGASGGQRREMQRERLAALQAKRSTASTEPLPATDGLPAVVATALRLVAGEHIEPPADRSTTIARLRTEIATIEEALRVTECELADRREDLSEALAQSLRPQHFAILRSKLDAVLAVCAAVQAERALTTAMIVAGYETRPGTLLSPPIAPADQLGSVDAWDAPVNAYRRALELIGVL
jgi:hypothetical protein